MAENGNVVHLTPEAILAEGNSRYGLKESNIKKLMDSILEAGRVIRPIEVVKLAKKQGTKTHRLIAGFYRLEAVQRLNKEQNAGLTLPALEQPADMADVDVLKQQLSENMDRENQSPMDQAVAIDRLLKAGVERGEVRRIFARATGPKGALQPASNSWMNITLRFLELPKPIQSKIHDGQLSMAGAYELGRVSPEKRARVLELAEAEREAAMEREAKEEDRYLTAEKKAAEARESVKALEEKQQAQKAEVENAINVVKEKQAALKELMKTPIGDVPDTEKKAFNEKMAATRQDNASAEKVAKDAKNALAKTATKLKHATETAEDKAAKLEETRKAVKAKKKAPAVGPAEVKAAAREEGEGAGHIALNAPEMRALIRLLAEQKDYVKVAQFSQVILRCCDGVSTPKQCCQQLAVLTGELKGKVVARPKGTTEAPKQVVEAADKAPAKVKGK